MKKCIAWTIFCCSRKYFTLVSLIKHGLFERFLRKKRNFQEHVFVEEVTAFVKNFENSRFQESLTGGKWRTICRFSNKLWINPTRLVTFSMVIVDGPTERGEQIFYQKSYINAITSFRKYWNTENTRKCNYFLNYRNKRKYCSLDC